MTNKIKTKKSTKIYLVLSDIFDDDDVLNINHNNVQGIFSSRKKAENHIKILIKDFNEIGNYSDNEDDIEDNNITSDNFWIVEEDLQ